MRPRGGVAALLPLLLALGACGGDREIERPTPAGDTVPVEYPLALWDAGIEGETVVRARVTSEGRVDSVELALSSGTAALDTAALEGVAAMRFRPARREGEEIAVWARIPVRFERDSVRAGSARVEPPPDGPGSQEEG